MSPLGKYLLTHCDENFYINVVEVMTKFKFRYSSDIIWAYITNLGLVVKIELALVAGDIVIEND